MAQSYPPSAWGPGSGSQNILNTATPMTRVELTVSAVNLKDKDILSLSDPLCVLYMREKGQDSFHEFGRTELIKNSLNPHWMKKFEIDYRFEERQLLKFHVYDWDVKSESTHGQDSLGFVECSLGEIMACQGSQFKKVLSSNGGILIISGEEVSSSKEIACLTFNGRDLDKKDFLGKSDPFLILYRCLENKTYVPVHKSEVIKKNLNPVWKPFEVPVRNLCAGDYERTIKIECYDWDSDGNHELIGECFTNLATLKEGSGSKNVYTLINPKKKAKKSSYKSSGQLILNNISIHIKPSFLDYIQGGLQLHFTVAVDFTASNGDPQNPQSLHYRQLGVDNQYSLAIRAVGEIIQDYDFDKLFPALGFGAQIPPDMKVNHEFFLNGRHDSPYCQGVEGILQAYNYSLQSVRLYGPTNFSPVIKHVSQFAKANLDGSSYFVLLIITDGIITDLNETKKALIEASSLPMSVIIVGVGKEDFSAMELLDADNKRLCCDGVYAQRDIVQFVELREFFSSNAAQFQADLASAVLKEVPSQVCAFMQKTIQRETSLSSVLDSDSSLN